MAFYYTIWFLISILSIFYSTKPEAKVIFIIFLVFLCLMTGFRYEVGGDWENYLNIYDYFKGIDIAEALTITEPGYALLNYFSQVLNFKNIVFVNAICSILFYSFFYKFSKKVENYWIPVLLAFPYLILVVSMGYTRQSVAIAFVSFAVVYGLEKNIIKFFIFSLLAILFHKSAIIVFMFLPLLLNLKYFSSTWFFSFYSLFSFLTMSGLVYYSSLSGDNIYTNQNSEVSSAGAIFRVVVHFLALFFYLLYRKKIVNSFNNYRIFDYMSLLIIFVFLLAIPFSTLADRFNLYLIIFDILVFSYLFSNISVNSRKIMVLIVIFFNSLMLYIWLNFGAWSHAWLPYQNYLLRYILESI
ncbi:MULTISPECIES: EpsG family protein [Acinetobacter calcoaceticus/baumannii complex]|uniref:EpsG family protein n=1 Tax=Acinetobacter calcoaceticus/baumannii complex TaxID=909768 RepID=UPI0019336045|nr:MULTISPECIES: EpsG family protein [Acinetobacter calcoaceticus/baumannii complex]MBP1491304.1 EpsG family protein [Acinetobacter nosocomialis]MCZ3261734.1 EpsG family protein [Acinetobacter baumannii]QRF09902.1 EpsG family protein [Acinetobacter pittii]